MDTGESAPGGVGPTAPLISLGELLPDGLVVAHGDGTIRFVNAEASRILDRDPSALVGHDLVAALPLTDKYGRDWWAQSNPWEAPQSETGHQEKLLVTAAGREILVTSRFVRFGDGHRLDRVLLGLRDAEARLEAERDQANVLATVAHELRAPLTSVLGFTSSLLRRWDRFNDAQKKLMIETIEADAKRLTRLITELLDISRLDSDRLDLRLGPVDLEGLLSRHLLRHDLALQPGDIRLELGPAAQVDGVPELWADADRLEQVFFNLIENGLRHGSGTVTVILDRDDTHVGDGSHEPAHLDGARDGARDGAPGEVPGGVVVHVDDEGDGIPEDDRVRVFGRFWHGADSATTGLGLYVASGLVQAHGGRIEVGASESGGARFTVRLRGGLPDALLDPAADSRAAGPTERGAAAPLD